MSAGAFVVGAVIGWLLGRPLPAAAAPGPTGERFGPFDIDGRPVTVEVAQETEIRLGSLRRKT